MKQYTERAIELALSLTEGSVLEVKLLGIACLPCLSTVSTGSDPRQLSRACETTNGRSCLPTTYIYGRLL